MNVKALMSLLVVVGLTASAAADKPVHIFILSGQSNMAGMNPKAGFEPEAKMLFPDAEVVYIKIARGGQPIRLWVKEYPEIAKKYDLAIPGKYNGTVYYEPILTQYRGLLDKHPNPASVTFCWMQGERDAKEKLSAGYADAMKQLIANLRRDLKQPEMNFVIGRLSDFGPESNKEWQAVRQVQVEISQQDKRGAWVDCDDLNDKEKNGQKRNDLHYTKEGYELLGRRHARQAMALIKGKKPDAKGRPE